MGTHALRPAALLAALLLLGACETLEPAQTRKAASSPDVQRGLAIAQAHCAQCHTIGRTGTSPYAPAPAFPVIARKYPPEMLAEALAEGIAVGHQGPVQMPEFAFPPKDIDALIAYLESLR